MGRNIKNEDVNCYNCKQQYICSNFAQNKGDLDRLHDNFYAVARDTEKRYSLSNDCKIWVCGYFKMFAEQCSRFTLIAD